jgi:hypothetical protein
MGGGGVTNRAKTNTNAATCPGAVSSFANKVMAGLPGARPSAGADADAVPTSAPARSGSLTPEAAAGGASPAPRATRRASRNAAEVIYG